MYQTDRERKRQDQTDRRKETQKLLEDEEARFSSKGIQPCGQSKVTRGQIHDGLRLEQEREQLARQEAKGMQGIRSSLDGCFVLLCYLFSPLLGYYPRRRRGRSIWVYLLVYVRLASA